MPKIRFQPNEQVVVSDDPEATVYTINCMYKDGSVNLTYQNNCGRWVNGGDMHVSLLQYPTIGQLLDKTAVLGEE